MNKNDIIKSNTCVFVKDGYYDCVFIEDSFTNELLGFRDINGDHCEVCKVKDNAIYDDFFESRTISIREINFSDYLYPWIPKINENEGKLVNDYTSVIRFKDNTLYTDKKKLFVTNESVKLSGNNFENCTIIMTNVISDKEEELRIDQLYTQKSYEMDTFLIENFYFGKPDMKFFIKGMMNQNKYMKSLIT